MPATVMRTDCSERFRVSKGSIMSFAFRRFARVVPSSNLQTRFDAVEATSGLQVSCAYAGTVSIDPYCVKTATMAGKRTSPAACWAQ